MSDSPKYLLNIDTGGTFTDCIAMDPAGRILRRKVLSNASLRATLVKQISAHEIQISTNWAFSIDLIYGYELSFFNDSSEIYQIVSFNPVSRIVHLNKPLSPSSDLSGSIVEITAGEEAPVLCTRLITETPLDKPFPPLEMRLGSTKGTNALLEYKGARTALLLTKGFKDLLSIGTQQRPDIFAREVIKPPLLSNDTFEVNERLDARGKVLKKIDQQELQKTLDRIKAEGIKTVGVALMHSWINPIHEILIHDLLKKNGFEFISISHRLSNLIKYLPRLQTTEVNAYLSPIINQYIHNIQAIIKSDNISVMTSAGGLVQSKDFLPKDSLLSGPAGGVIGAANIGRITGYEKIISFDMGGTSTDVSRYDSKPEYSFELKIGAANIQSAALSIETVAAGGGSICRFDGYKLLVGPESAGAKPGPACYGAGGPLTLTDVNLLSGRMDPSQFNIPIYPAEAEKKLVAIKNAIKDKTGTVATTDEVLAGFLRIANETMAGAIKKISSEKGFDTANYAMVAFGGAGGMHACSIATLLNMSTVIIPADAGLLSAYGIGEAVIERFAEKQILKDLTPVLDINSWFDTLDIEATNKLLSEGLRKNEIRINRRMVFVRFKGQESSLEILWDSADRLIADFKKSYTSIYGHWTENRLIEIESVRVIASGIKNPDQSLLSEKTSFVNKIPRMNQGHPIYHRNQVEVDHGITGPAIIIDSFSTSYIDQGWKASADERGTLTLKKQKETGSSMEDTLNEVAELELYSKRFMSIAENMGAMLQRTAVSVNVKERLDFSCALLDKDGFLVANAPHIPVHLGSLGICVRSVLKKFELNPGDTIVTNHPAYGGSHLPDITLITAVFSDTNYRLGYVVNRAHHSEIGGISPGSMPPAAMNLSEEGVVIFPFYLIKGGVANWKGMESILTSAPHPTRSLHENLADLNAAIAANRRGVKDLLELANLFSNEKIEKYMKMLRMHASLKTKETIRSYPLHRGHAIEFLDDNTRLEVKFSKQDEGFKIDFTGTSPVHSGNLNANPAIVHSVIMYVLRLMLNEDIPLNDGMLDPIEVILPTSLLNPPFPEDPALCPALVGGNVEVSQRLTDTILKALELQAASQGTMNNVLFGNENFGYYETICGGCGAGDGFKGADAVHHHMTNTRITDPEIMEHHFPVRLERFEIRSNSGGKGKYEGGNGIIREIKFLEKVELSLLTQRRNSGPYGMKGGENGEPGEQSISTSSGIIKLGSICSLAVNKGDSIIIKTPGGGGFGVS